MKVEHASFSDVNKLKLLEIHHMREQLAQTSEYFGMLLVHELCSYT